MYKQFLQIPWELFVPKIPLKIPGGRHQQNYNIKIFRTFRSEF